MPSLQQHVYQSDRKANVPIDSWRYVGHGLATRKDIFVQPSFSLVESHTVGMNGDQHGNGLFSSSMSEIFNKNLTLSTNNVVSGKSIDSSTPGYDKPFESLEDMEVQTIGNLLPDDDDLLSGVFDELNYISQPTNGDDIEEFDLCCSGGGMELGDDGSEKFIDVVGSSINGQQSGVDGSHAGEHPSRILFVRNINSDVKESELKPLFEQYGDTLALYMACKHRGFVMSSYYDIRAARNVTGAPHNKSLRHIKLDIHFSILKPKTKLCLFDGDEEDQMKINLENIETGWYQKEKDLQCCHLSSGNNIEMLFASSLPP